MIHYFLLYLFTHYNTLLNFIHTIYFIYLFITTFLKTTHFLFNANQRVRYKLIPYGHICLSTIPFLFKVPILSLVGLMPTSFSYPVFFLFMILFFSFFLTQIIHYLPFTFSSLLPFTLITH